MTNLFLYAALCGCATVDPVTVQCKNQTVQQQCRIILPVVSCGDKRRFQNPRKGMS